MKYFSHVVCFGFLVILQSGCFLVVAGEEDGDEVAFPRVRRGWSMYRLGRGLQMLRLGKRGVESPMEDGATAEEYQSMLAPVLGRRQLPLPRYGKDLESQQRALEQELADRGMPIYWRPAPRGGRFKRAHPLNAKNANLLSRAVALPRIGRLVLKDALTKDSQKDKQNDNSEERAVPIPRIGRAGW